MAVVFQDLLLLLDTESGFNFLGVGLDVAEVLLHELHLLVLEFKHALQEPICLRTSRHG